MAAIWKGSLTFGLVNIPVELKTAVRADHISFRLLHEEDLSPVKYERVCQADGDPRQRRSRPDVASARQSRGRQWKKRSSPRKEKVGGRRSQFAKFKKRQTA